MSKILFLASYYPNAKSPLQGPFMRRHAQAIALYNDVCVLTIDKATDLKTPYTLDFTIENQIPTMRILYNLDCPNIPIVRSIVRFYRFFQGLLRGYAFLKKQYGQFDKVHLNVVHLCGTLALWLKLFHNLPFIVTEHSTIYMDNEFKTMGIFNQWLHKWVLKSAETVTVVSKIQGLAIQKHCNIPHFTVVPNVIQADLYKIIAEKASAKDGIKRIVHISTLAEWKGVDAILIALSLIRKKRQDFRLDIIGSTVDRIAHYKNICDALGVANIVTFHGMKDEKTIAIMLPAYDFMVLNSAFETFCVVMVEAFACGLPVVAPVFGAIPENLNNERGILTTARDAETLRETIEKMLENSEKYDPLSIRQYVLENFTPEIIGKKFTALY